MAWVYAGDRRRDPGACGLRSRFTRGSPAAGAVARFPPPRTRSSARASALTTAWSLRPWAWTFGRGHALHELADGAGHDLGRLWALLVRKLRYARAMRMVMPPSRSSE